LFVCSFVCSFVRRARARDLVRSLLLRSFVDRSINRSSIGRSIVVLSSVGRDAFSRGVTTRRRRNSGTQRRRVTASSRKLRLGVGGDGVSVDGATVTVAARRFRGALTSSLMTNVA